MSASATREPSVTTFEELRPPLAAADARVEADRCLECGGPLAPAPCVAACPAAVDVPGFVAALADGDSAGAARTILAENLLGATCARVCPVEVLCEGACVLLHEGRPAIEIARLQRFALDHAPRAAMRARTRRAANGRRVAVVGAGPAGLVCAGELALLGYAVTVYDERPEPGGLARYAIAPYRMQREPLPAETQELRRLGVELRLGARVGPAELAALADGAGAVFLGVGMGADADPSCPGEELAGVWSSLDFVAALKTGRPVPVGRRMVVFGGGNTAVDVARESVRLGARAVTLVYRRTRAEMPAFGFEVDAAGAEGVRFRWLAAPARFLGERKLEAVECVQMRLGEPDVTGRRRPEPVPGSEFVLPADTAVLAIGQRGRPELAEWIERLAVDRGKVEVDPGTGRTGNPKFFAGGDVVNGGATVVDAVRDGKRAARAIDEWLRCAS